MSSSSKLVLLLLLACGTLAEKARKAGDEMVDVEKDVTEERSVTKHRHTEVINEQHHPKADAVRGREGEGVDDIDAYEAGQDELGQDDDGLGSNLDGVDDNLESDGPPQNPVDDVGDEKETDVTDVETDQTGGRRHHVTGGLGRCSDRAPCPPRQRCMDGRCEDGCEVDFDCSPRDICRSGKCESADGFCADGTDCPPGQTCSGGKCDVAAGGCVNDFECSPGEECVDGKCSSPGATRCFADRDCDSGDKCVGRLCKHASDHHSSIEGGDGGGLGEPPLRPEFPTSKPHIHRPPIGRPGSYAPPEECGEEIVSMLHRAKKAILAKTKQVFHKIMNKYMRNGSMGGRGRHHRPGHRRPGHQRPGHFRPGHHRPGHRRPRPLQNGPGPYQHAGQYGGMPPYGPPTRGRRHHRRHRFF